MAATLGEADPRDGLFVSTQWTIVRNATDSRAATEVAARALSELCRIYWPPIYGYIRRRGYAMEDAQDLTQSFFQHLIENETLRRACREKGRFRSFLLGALKLCLADEHARSQALKRGREIKFISVDDLEGEELHHQRMSHELSPDELLDVRWAGLLLERALATLRLEFVESGRLETFEALSPYIADAKGDVSYETTAARLGLGLGATKTLIHRLRRRFAAVLRHEIVQTVSAPREVDDELRALRAGFLPRRGTADRLSRMRATTISRRCETCGSDLDLEAPSDFCPGCLLTVALEENYGDAQPGGQIGDYEILEEIARGGMGIVYRARQRTPSRVVALKMILPSHIGSPDALARFRGETEAAASLDHEGILPIYAVGEKDGIPFYSMKFAEGGSLASHLAEFADKPRASAQLISKLARAVAHAHEHGILHRDLKPGNVLFDAASKPFVSDFGLARWLGREGDLTQTLAILGTPFYMAPEQTKNAHSITAAADIYSLGAILFHLLTGQPPFRGENAIEVLRNAAERPAPRPRTLNRKSSGGSRNDLLEVSREKSGRPLFLRDRAGG